MQDIRLMLTVMSITFFFVADVKGGLYEIDKNNTANATHGPSQVQKMFRDRTEVIIIIIIKAICNAQDPRKKAANALSGSLKMLLSIYNVSYKQQCLQLCPKGCWTGEVQDRDLY